VLGIVSVGVMLVHLDPMAAAVGLALTVVGLLTGWLLRSRAGAGNRWNES
jgi:hypothetical protein